VYFLRTLPTRKQEWPNNGRGPKSKTVAAVIIALHWQYRYVRGTEARHNSRPIYERTPANGTVPATNIWERNGDNEILLSGLFQCPTIYDWYGAMAEIQHAETTATNEECAKPYNYGAQGAYSTDKMAGVCTRLSGSSSATKIDMRQYSTVWGTVYGAENLGWPCTRILLVCISLRKKRIEHHRPASKRGSSERAPTGRVLVGNCCDIAREPISTVSMVQRRIRQWPTMTCHGCIIT